MWARVNGTGVAEKMTLESGLQSKISVSGRLSTEWEWGGGQEPGPGGRRDLQEDPALFTFFPAGRDQVECLNADAPPVAWLPGHTIHPSLSVATSQDLFLEARHRSPL